MMRLTALFLVLLAHSLLFYVDNIHWPVRAAEQSYFAEWSAIFIYYITIPAFVFISGFLLAKSYQNRPQPLRKIIGNRFRRLIIPWFLVGVLWVVPTDTLFDIPVYMRPVGTSLTDGYQAFFVGLYTSHLWFLLALFWATLSCMLILPILKKHPLISLIITLLMALAAQLFLDSVQYYTLSQIALPILCFGFGMFFYHAKDWVETLPKSRKSVLLTTLFIALIALICFDCSIKRNLYIGWLISIMGCLGIYYMFDFLQYKRVTRKMCSSKLYRWFDSNSMEYYLFHMPFPMLFFMILYPISDITPILFIALIFIFTVAATTIVVWIISRVKRQKCAVRSGD